MSQSEVAVSAFAVWTADGVCVGGPPPRRLPGPLARWSAAAPLASIHPRARRPHPSVQALVQLTHALLGARGPAALDRARTGLVLGTQSGCAAADRDFLDGCLQRGPAFGSPSVFVYTLSTAALGEVAIALGLKGGLCTVSSGATSGLDALVQGATHVASGRLAACVVGSMELAQTTSGGRGDDGPGDVLALFLLEPTRAAPTAPALGDWRSGRSAGAASGADGVSSLLQLAHHLSASGAARGPAVLGCRGPEGLWASVSLIGPER